MRNQGGYDVQTYEDYKNPNISQACTKKEKIKKEKACFARTILADLISRLNSHTVV